MKLDELKIINQIKETPWYKEFVEDYGEEPEWFDGDYDYIKAWKSGAKPDQRNEADGKYHWPSTTPDGEMLKSKDHPTYWMEEFMERTGIDPSGMTQEEAEELVK